MSASVEDELYAVKAVLRGFQNVFDHKILYLRISVGQKSNGFSVTRFTGKFRMLRYEWDRKQRLTKRESEIGELHTVSCEELHAALVRIRDLRRIDLASVFKKSA
jgi:hypothetical protein